MSLGVRVPPAFALEELDRPERVSESLRARGVRLDADEVVLLARLLGRAPAWAEAVLFGILWSEHCSYKSTRHLLRRLPTRAPQVVLGPGEDAGVVSLPAPSADQVLVLAHESHNHPSQVLPVEGAATGVGGIVRDVACMGATVVGVLDSLRFGDPASGIHVRDVIRGVVEGVAGYGNPLGVPNLGGDTVFDAGYDRNVLVNVMAVGLAPADGVLRSRVPAGDEAWVFVLVGKPTDSSGFGGAAFASDALKGDDDRGAVQLPDPFLKRVLSVANEAAFARLRERGVRAGFKDLGAGGVACATSELAAAGGRGARIHLDRAHRVARPLAAEVLLCAETQERFCWVVPESFAAELCDLYQREFAIGSVYPGAAATIIGEVTDDGRFTVDWSGDVLVDCDVTAITAGREVRRPSRVRVPEAPGEPDGTAPAAPLAARVEWLLERLEVCPREYLTRHYDGEVQGRARLRAGEADASVIRAGAVGAGGGSAVSLAFASGGHPRWCAADPQAGARHAVAEAARKVAAVGAVPWALTDCLNYGDALDPAVMGDLEAGIDGLAAAAEALGGLAATGAPLPFVSGNVSLYNVSDGVSIPPSPIVMCAGVIDADVPPVPMALTRAGDVLVRVGAAPVTLTGSAFLRATAGSAASGGAPPPLDLEREAALHAFAVASARERRAAAAHAVGDGGTLVAIVEMLRAGPAEPGLGVDVRVPGGEPVDMTLFSECPAIVFAVPADRAGAFAEDARLQGLDAAAWGEVTGGGRFVVAAGAETASWDAGTVRAMGGRVLERIWNEELDS